MTAVLRDGPERGPATVVLMHGAGSGPTQPFLADIAAAFVAAGLPVVRFPFPYRAAGRSYPDRMDVLQQSLRDVVAAHVRGPLVLGGRSMGGRVATMLADELQARAVVVFGYPFHPPGKPTQLRTEHLAALRTPTWIAQGERDEFGTREDVAGYTLAPTVHVEWFRDGDHALKPRRASGCTLAQHEAAAIAGAVAFAQARL